LSSEQPETTTIQPRVTRKKKLTGMYSDLLSKKTREAYFQDNNIGEVEPAIPLAEPAKV
jgi:hypothetical protein